MDALRTTLAALLPATSLGRGAATLASSAVVDFAVQWSVFLVSAVLHTEKLYDLTGTQTFVLLVLLNAAAIPERHPRHVIATAFVVLWGVRLGWYLVARVLEVGEDSRFRKVKGNPGLFFIYWTIQGVWVIVSLLPVLLLLAVDGDQQQPLGWVDVTGWAVFAGGYLLEAVADAQKYAVGVLASPVKRFRQLASNKGKWIDEGVWRAAVPERARRSRHPNYVGEVVLWLGIFLSCISGLPQATLPIACISPLWVYYQLRFLSGVPILERTADKRWGKEAAYNAYKQRVPVFFPRLF